ncbi:PLP-dependent aminotransferase family protein [Bradyrhizobium jicamae]|uniref:PLP-dependent aminotransferase family protein n=1 Tax=Bradyrhizobium jicamae TaxID=280332 RepID=A0ABS5FU38_9BRAD|nr:PLP-dependent aminotransferase family protein [Bradyrhizobium jicamae]MBR0800309.1 PLP-dependent aminotransferase family protein [Bradyrhizobium jicamae]
MTKRFDSAVERAGPRFAPWLSDTNDLTSRNIEASRIPGLVNLSGGLPDPVLLPTKALGRIATTVIRDYPHDCFGYGPTAGLPQLREAIARRYRARGVPVVAENVLVTASGTQTLDLVGKLLAVPGDTIVCEFPSYAGAFDAWRPRDPKYRHLGLRAGDDLRANMAGAAFAYLIPNFSNPTGYLVTEEERLRLIAAAWTSGTPLVEDDPYGSLYYDGDPIPTMLRLASLGRENLDDCPVIHLASLSKQLAPGMRIGWIIAAPATIRALNTAKQATDLCSNGLAQCMAAAAMEAGLIEECHPRIVSLYRTRRDALCAAMSRHIDDWFTWEVPVGGMFVWATARDPRIDVDLLVDVGMETGVLVGAGHHFDPLRIAPPAIRLSFTFNDETKLELGISRLAQALEALGTRASSVPQRSCSSEMGA